jgi:hypothetical protein
LCHGNINLLRALCPAADLDGGQLAGYNLYIFFNYFKTLFLTPFEANNNPAKIGVAQCRCTGFGVSAHR